MTMKAPGLMLPGGHKTRSARIKIFWMDANEQLALFSFLNKTGPSFVVEGQPTRVFQWVRIEGLPDDAVAVGAFIGEHYSFGPRLGVYVESATFAEVAHGAPVPELVLRVSTYNEVLHATDNRGADVGAGIRQ